MLLRLLNNNVQVTESSYTEKGAVLRSLRKTVEHLGQAILVISLTNKYLANGFTLDFPYMKQGGAEV
jgi:hypothetical protein